MFYQFPAYFGTQEDYYFGTALQWKHIRTSGQRKHASGSDEYTEIFFSYFKEPFVFSNFFFVLSKSEKMNNIK